MLIDCFTGNMMTTILLIGHQTNFVADLREILECEQFNILTAMPDDAGIQLAQQFCPNLILYDLEVQVMYGKGVSSALQLAERTPHIPLLCLTNAERHELPNAAYLLKPFSIPELLQMMTHMLTQSAGTPVYQPTGAFNT